MLLISCTSDGVWLVTACTWLVAGGLVTAAGVAGVAAFVAVHWAGVKKGVSEGGKPALIYGEEQRP